MELLAFYVVLLLSLEEVASAERFAIILCAVVAEEDVPPATFVLTPDPFVLRLAAAPPTLLVLFSCILLDGLDPVYLWLPGRLPLDVFGG